VHVCFNGYFIKFGQSDKIENTPFTFLQGQPLKKLQTLKENACSLTENNQWNISDWPTWHVYVERTS